MRPYVLSLPPGCIYLHKCSLEPKIPIWMIVYGAAALIVLVFNVMSLTWDCIANRGKDLANRTHGNLFDVFSSLLGLFLFIWLIVGSVWIFAPYTVYNGAGRPNCSVAPESPICCERPIYLFAFAVAIFGWASIGLVLLLFCLTVSIGCCCAGAVLAGYSSV